MHNFVIHIIDLSFKKQFLDQENIFRLRFLIKMSKIMLKSIKLKIKLKYFQFCECPVLTMYYTCRCLMVK